MAPELEITAEEELDVVEEAERRGAGGLVSLMRQAGLVDASERLAGERQEEAGE